MRVLRALGGSLLWILAGVVGLLGVLLSVTVILLPVGIPLVLLARKLFKYSLTLFLPRSVRHPAQESGKALKDAGKQGRKLAEQAGKAARKKTGKKARKKAGKRMGRRLSLGG